MSLFDMNSWFGSGNDNQVTQTSSMQMPQFFEDFTRTSFNALDNLTRTGYQPYDQGPRIAGFSDLQTDTINKFKSQSPTYASGSALQGLNSLSQALHADPARMANASQEQATFLGGMNPMGLAEILSSGQGQGMLLGNIGNALQTKFGAGSGTAVQQLQQLSTQLQNAPAGTDVHGQQRALVNSLSAGDIADLLRSPEAASQYGPKFREILGTRLAELSSAQTNTPMGQAISMAGNFQPVSADQVTAQRLGDTDLNQYMNPYISSVVDTTMAELKRQADIENLGIKANATMAGGFGDARHGVAEGELRGRQMDIGSRLTGELMMGGYDRAMSLAGTDIANDLNAQLANQGSNLHANQFNQTGNLSAAGMMGSLAGQRQNMDLNEMRAMWDIGAQEQNMAQSNFDLMYSDWLRQQQHPQQMIEQRLAAIQGRPFSSTQTVTGPGANQTAQELGLLAALMGGVGSFTSRRN